MLLFTSDYCFVYLFKYRYGYMHIYLYICTILCIMCEPACVWFMYIYLFKVVKILKLDWESICLLIIFCALIQSIGIMPKSVTHLTIAFVKNLKFCNSSWLRCSWIFLHWESKQLIFKLLYFLMEGLIDYFLRKKWNLDRKCGGFPVCMQLLFICDGF